MSLTPAQSRLIQATLPALRAHGEQISSIFYATMLREHPELRNIFNSANQANGRQPRALTAIIIAFAANIAHTSELAPKLERVCHKHCSLGIRPDQYAIVGEYLIRAFTQVLGEAAMTPDVCAAWSDAYCVLARMMMGREAHLYKTFGTWRTWRRMRVSKRVAESEDVYSFYLVPIPGDDGGGSTTTSSSDRPTTATPPTRHHTSFATRLRTDSPARSSSSLSMRHGRESTLSFKSGSGSASGCGSGSASSSGATAPLPRFLPGQYVSVRMLLAGLTGSSLGSTSYQSRQYSLSARYRPDSYRISIKRDEGTRFANTVSASFLHPGLVSNAIIDTVHVGDTLEVSHPTGEFFFDPGNGAGGSSSPLVLLSAGIGAAPMMAILETVAAAQPRRAVTYIHGSRYSPPVFFDALQDLQKDMPALRTAFFFSGHHPATPPSPGGGAASSTTSVAAAPVSPASSSSSFSSSYTRHSRHVLHAMANAHQPLSAHPPGCTAPGSAPAPTFREFQGHVDMGKLLRDEDLHLDNSSTEYYVCGPESFMLDAAKHLVDHLGVARNRIRVELFSTGDLEDQRDGRVAMFLGRN